MTTPRLKHPRFTTSKKLHQNCDAEVERLERLLRRTQDVLRSIVDAWGFSPEEPLIRKAIELVPFRQKGSREEAGR